MAEKSNYQIAQEVLDGKWGNGVERRTRLYEAGYDANAIQTIVNVLVRERELEKAQDNFLTVEVDLDKYSGINLKFKKG